MVQVVFFYILLVNFVFCFFCFLLFLKECQKKLDHKLGLDSYLLKPVQRLTKYQLLLKVLVVTKSNIEQLIL